MKKWIAAILALVMMLSFAMAEEDEILLFDFNDAHSADEQQNSGTFVQLGESDYKIWIPKSDDGDIFVQLEIPQEEKFAETVMLLGYSTQPEHYMRVDSFETELTYDQVLANLQGIDMLNTVSDLRRAIVNGFPSLLYNYRYEDGTEESVIECFVKENYIIKFVLMNNGHNEYLVYGAMTAYSLQAK